MPKRYPPWKIRIVRRASTFLTGWKCPYCGSDIAIEPSTIECYNAYKETGNAYYPNYNVVAIGYEIYCTNPNCPGKYDKIIDVMLFPPNEPVAPKTTSEFETDVMWLG